MVCINISLTFSACKRQAKYPSQFQSSYEYYIVHYLALSTLTFFQNLRKTCEFCLSVMCTSCLNILFVDLFLFSRNFFLLFSLAVHPNKLLIATGQATGHDRREGRVRIFVFIN